MQVKLETFEAVLTRGDMKELKANLQEFKETDREKYASKAVAVLKKARKGSVQEKNNMFRWYWDLGEEALKASITATLALADEKQLSSLDWSNPAALRYADWEIIEDLHPKGLVNFAEIIIEANLAYFSLVRKLVKSGLSQKPTSEAYYTGLIGGALHCQEDPNKQIKLKEILLKEEDFLEDIWQCFTVEGDQENSFASVDKYTPAANRWETAIVELSKEGHLSRDRLLDKTLESLTFGFIQFRSTWFSRLHESLNPTLEERQARLAKYGMLIGSSIPSTVSFAIKALKKCCSKTPLPKDFLLEYISGALTAESKTTVTAALSMIEKTLKSDDTFKDSGCLLSTEALSNESTEVQKKCLALITKYGDKSNQELVERLQQNKEIIAKSVVGDLESWLPAKQASKTIDKEENNSNIETVHYKEIPSASDGFPFKFFKELAALENIEETIERAAFCLENSNEVLEYEIVIDAISRLPVNEDGEFVKSTGALAKRALKFHSSPPYTVSTMQRLKSAFIYDWLTGNQKLLLQDDQYKHLSAVNALVRDRMRGILSRIASGKYLPVISAPTHEGGWTDAGTLSERFKSYMDKGESPDEADLCLAMFRSPKELILKQLSSLAPKDDFTSALAYGAELSDRKPKNKMLFQASRFLRESTGHRDVLDLGAGDLLISNDTYETANWLYLSMPVIRESYFGINIGHASKCIEWMEVPDYRIAASLERLMDSGAPLKESAHELMAIGLTVENPECTGIARESAIIAISEGRLNIKIFAFHISRYFHSERSKPKRLANSLFEISRVSPLHVNAVTKTLELVLSSDHETMPRGLSYVLETFEELLAQDGRKLADPDTIEYLKKIKTGGKTARIISRLLQV